MSYYEDEIYHSGYLDGYYASMALYHSDDSELTEEEKAKARRRRRRRNIALGVGLGAAGVLGGTYAYNEIKNAKELHEAVKSWKKAKPRKTVTTTHSEYDPTADYSGRTRIYRAPKPKKKRTIPGFRRNPGTYRMDPTKDFGGYLTLHGMHIRARMQNQVQKARQNKK